jgi:hypothetical protein
MPHRFAAALRAVALTLLLCGPAGAHEGHDHGDAPKPAATVAAPRGEASSELFELVAVLREGALVAYLDRFTTNEPVLDAAISVETPSGSAEMAAMPDGTYRVDAPWAAGRDGLDLVFTVSAGDGVEVLPLAIALPAAAPPPAAGMPLLGSLRERLGAPDAALLVVATGAFLLGAAFALLLWRAGPASALALAALAAGPLAGEARAAGPENRNEARPGAAVPAGPADVPQRLPDGSVFVPKSTQRILALRTAVSEDATHRRTVELPGRIIPDPDASGVVQSSVGGRLSPPEGGFPRLGTIVKRGDILALVTPPVQAIDVSDMRQRQGELDQQIAIVSQRVARYGRLAPSGAIAQTQLEEAQLELAGLRDRRAALDRIRRDPEALVAPVDGAVAEANAVAGQMAAPGVAMFQIVDPARLWVEALSFGAMEGRDAATARLAGGRSLDLAFRGAGFSDRNQAAPAHFAIRGDTAGLRVGQFVTVLAASDERLDGLAVPRASVVRTGAGQDVVYEHASAERFNARPVRVVPLDGQRVLVVAGLEPGRRVVTQGAELLDQVR